MCAQKDELSAEPFAGVEITWLRWQEYWFCFANMYVEPDFEVCAQCRQMNGWRMGGRRVGASCGEAATCNRSSTHLLKIFPKIFSHPPSNIPPYILPLACCKYCPKYSPTHLLQILPQIIDHPSAFKLKISVKPCFLQMHFAWTLGQGLRGFIGNEYIWS